MGVCQLEYLIKSPDFRAFQVMLSHLAKRESLQKMNGPSTGNNNPRNLQICTVPTTRSAWVHRAAWFHVHFINIIHTHTHTLRYFTKKEKHSQPSEIDLRFSYLRSRRFVDKSARYRHTRKFLSIFSALSTAHPFSRRCERFSFGYIPRGAYFFALFVRCTGRKCL